MGELLEKETCPEPVFSHVVHGPNTGCLDAVGTAKSDLKRGTREEPNAEVRGEGKRSLPESSAEGATSTDVLEGDNGGKR